MITVSVYDKGGVARLTAEFATAARADAFIDALPPRITVNGDDVAWKRVALARAVYPVGLLAAS